MSTTATETLPLEVGQLGNFEARMLRNLGAAIEDWDEVSSALGPWEATHLMGNDAAAEELHLSWLKELIAWGRLMQRMTGSKGFPDRVLASKVDARLQHLEDKLSMWHSKMTAAEEDRILRTAFA